MVSQEAVCFPWLSVKKNIEMGLQAWGVPKPVREREVELWLQRVDLDGFEEAMPVALSGGMRQRVALARALAAEPQVVLMDEPFGALDLKTRTAMQVLLFDLWKNGGLTVVFVTHDIEEAVFLGERILLFSARPMKLLREYRPALGERRFAALKTERQFLDVEEEIVMELRQAVAGRGEET